MNSDDQTVIELSKMKIALLVVGASAFVVAGVWMLSFDEAAVRSGRSFSAFFNDPLIVRGVGLASILFFGLCGLYGLKALFDKKPGLVLNGSGFDDNASALSAGFIPWSEVVGAGVLEIQKQKMLIIEVRDPEKYIARGGALKRVLSKANYKMSGSPIFIPSTALKMDFWELVSLFNRYHQKYGGGVGAAAAATSPLARKAGSPEVFHDRVGYVGGFAGPDAGPDAQLLNWSPSAVKGTVGAGGIGILVLSLSSLDILFQIQPPFWLGFTVSLLPMFIFFLAVPDMLPLRVVRPAQGFAVVLYLALSVVSVSLAVGRGLEGVDLLLIGFIMLGAWPCLLAIRKLRLSRGASLPG